MAVLLVLGLVAFTIVKRPPTRSAAADGVLDCAGVVVLVPLLVVGVVLEGALAGAVVAVVSWPCWPAWLELTPGGSLVVEELVDFLEVVVPPQEAARIVTATSDMTMQSTSVALTGRLLILSIILASFPFRSDRNRLSPFPFHGSCEIASGRCGRGRPGREA